MEEKIKYTPVKCTMKSCAFPNLKCWNCKCNLTALGKKAIKLKDPDKNYIFCREIILSYNK